MRHCTETPRGGYGATRSRLSAFPADSHRPLPPTTDPHGHTPRRPAARPEATAVRLPATLGRCPLARQLRAAHGAGLT